MNIHRQRKRMRLEEYDYSMPGAYFVTACTKNREFLFESHASKLAVESAWHSIVDVFANIELDEFIVMPNHIHCILCIINDGAYRLHPGTWKNVSVPADKTKFETLSNIVGAFKTTAATRVNKIRGVVGAFVWQKSFHDRIIRNDFELIKIQEYIRNNPVKWAEDRDNPDSLNFGSPTKSINDYWNEIFPENSL